MLTLLVGLGGAPTVIAALIAGVASISATLYSKHQDIQATIVSDLLEQRRQIEARWAEEQRQDEKERRKKKADAYEKVLETLFDLLKANISEQNGGEELSQDSLDIFYSMTKTLAIWGSDEVIRRWCEFRLSFVGSREMAPENYLLQLDNLLLAIRRDAGNPNTDLDSFELPKLFTNDVGDYEEELKALRRSRDS